jgi:hypothetical protein
LVFEPVSWDEAADSTRSGWAHNATLVDPCFHHPRSSFSRSINASIAEDDVDLRCSPPMDFATDHRRGPHRDVRAPLHPDERQDEMFPMDDDELQVRPETYRPSPELHPLDSAPAPADRTEESAEATEWFSSGVPLPIPLRPLRGKQDAELSHSPVFAHYSSPA